MRLNLEQNKECIITLSRFKFSLVINGLTEILKTIDSNVKSIENSIETNRSFILETWWFRSREKYL